LSVISSLKTIHNTLFPKILDLPLISNESGKTESFNTNLIECYFKAPLRIIDTNILISLQPFLPKIETIFNRIKIWGIWSVKKNENSMSDLHCAFATKK